MTIKDIKLEQSNDELILSAKCKIRKFGWDEIYFKTSVRNKAFVFDDASPFAAALLLPSMKKGEDLTIHGTISKQLYDGMLRIMRDVSQWGIGLKTIKISADRLAKDTQDPEGTGTFFSGGVDSFYTYLKHKRDKTKTGRVDSLIFVNNGFDIDPRNKSLWDLTLKNITKIAKDEGIRLIVVESNINTHELLAPIVPWDYIHGACLASVGLFLRNGLRRIYVPSTQSVDQQFPWGSNLALDKLWSTGITKFIHDGSERERLDKVVSEVAKSPLALKYLRVCYKNTSAAYNCGKCDKCLRTMVNLYIAGALDKAETFPRELDIELIANTPTIEDQYGDMYHKENLDALRKKNLNPELQKAIEKSLNITNFTDEPDNATKLRRNIIYLDHMYFRGHMYNTLSRMFGKSFS